MVTDPNEYDEFDPDFDITNCGPLLDFVTARIESKDNDTTVEQAIADFEASLEFLRMLPPETPIYKLVFEDGVETAYGAEQAANLRKLAEATSLL